MQDGQEGNLSRSRNIALRRVVWVCQVNRGNAAGVFWRSALSRRPGAGSLAHSPPYMAVARATTERSIIGAAVEALEVC